MIRNSIDFQRRTVEVLNQAAQKPMHIGAQFFGNQRQAILSAIYNVIQEIRVRHQKSVTHESSDNWTALSYW